MAEQLITAHLGDGYGETHLMVVGAGGGEEIVRFGCEHEDWYFQGVDPSSSMLEMTRQRVEQNRMSNRVALLQGTVHELAQGMVYDAASCLLVLHFVEELAQKRELLLQIATRLIPGAPLVLALISGDAGSADFSDPNGGMAKTYAEQRHPGGRMGAFFAVDGERLLSHPGLRFAGAAPSGRFSGSYPLFRRFSGRGMVCGQGIASIIVTLRS